jgi:protoporphyrinogen oxidase
VLCDGVTRLVSDLGVRVRLASPVKEIRTKDGRVAEAVLRGGERISGDVFVSTLPTEVFLHLLPADETAGLGSIRYTALLSTVCATRQRFDPDFYWLNLASPGHTACGIFVLSSLNPTIGRPGESCVNFVTHLRSRYDRRFRIADGDLLDLYRRDCREIFGFDLKPEWTNIARVPLYSPIFATGFRNPPLRSHSFENLWFAGNYRTFPSVASTGTALGSGIEAARAVLEDRGLATDLPDEVRRFRSKGSALS